MSIYIARPGDILMYRHAPNFDTKLIQFGEELEDGCEQDEYYHCAIALNPNTKIEAQGKSVAVDQIDYGNFDVFRPPLMADQISEGLSAVKECIGQRYDWVLIIDDALRYLTRNLIHLPVRYVKSEERKKKICSSLVALYLDAAGWKKDWSLSVSPEDVYLAVKDWRVT